MPSFIEALREGYSRDGGEHAASVPHIWRPGETAQHYWIAL